MKYIFLVLSVLILTASANGQKKTGNKKQPSSNEMAEMMKEMQQAMNELSEEDKKMLDSMGIKMPGMNNIQQMASFAMANAGKATAELSVPKRDASRIAGLPRNIMPATALPGYLQVTHQKITGLLPQALQQLAEKQYDAIRKQHSGTAVKAATAIGYWAIGNTRVAVFLMSEACIEDPSNSHNLNNFAAMLNMSGGEHLALPILQFLNRQYPNNSTVLNNMAHAWFGLGDISNASKYIDSTIRICAWHPQANQIRAAIAESKGNHDAAIKALKQSISRMYSQDKENALRDHGYSLKSDDIHFGPKNAPDQLGLSRFTWPALPKSVKASELLEPEWKAFRSAWDDRMATLQAENASLLAAHEEAFRQRMQNDVAAAGAGAGAAGLSAHLVPKAAAKLRPYIDQLVELEAKDPWGIALLRLYDTLSIYQQETAEEIRHINETVAPGGEGTGINPAYCAAIDGANDRLLQKANTFVEQFCMRYRDRAKKRITEMVNYQMYTEFPEKFALSVNLAKIEWMSYIMIADVVQFKNPVYCGSPKRSQVSATSALAQFDDINCPYRSEIDFIVSSIETSCGRTIAKINLPNFKAEWETLSADREANRNFFDEFQRCTIEASVGHSKEFGKGPLQLQATAQATAFLEFDRTGLKDAGIKAEAGIGVTTNVLDAKVNTDIGEVQVGPSERSISFGGAEATISISSGFTAGGTGILKGIKL